MNGEICTLPEAGKPSRNDANELPVAPGLFAFRDVKMFVKLKVPPGLLF